ncbi:hypothetical protein OEZ86_004614 [Tetradesmus obliquus]|nr:hypothetical protein OEZ86_004614 [Tetradesmus obliquus]
MASSIKRHDAGQQQQEQQQLHRANLTNCQFACLALTLSLGTISQWYDYTVYTQLSTTLAGVFFPASDWITAHLSFYGVYAAGFLARPLGAVCFGHVADAYSRRASVVTTMWVTLLATVGIGCLPTYQHVGVAAPVMLLVLRFVQGMSVGGEYGAAVVYLFEAAPVGRKGLCASLAQQAVAPGIILGILACLGVLHFCTPGQLLLWGWRVPFLAAALAAPFAVLLRASMVESIEFITSKRQHVLQRVAATAATRVADTFATQRTTSGKLMSRRQIQRQLQNVTKVVLSPNSSIQEDDDVADDASNGEEHLDAHAAPDGMEGMSARRARGVSNAGTVCSSRVHERTAAAAAAATDGGGAAAPSQKAELKLWLDESAAITDIGCEMQYVAQLELAGSKITTHVPLAVLARQHKQVLWLQFFLEASYATTFYIFTGWLPSYLRATTKLPPHSIMWALLAGMALFAAAAPYGGVLVDRGLPKVWALMGLSLGVVATSIPVMFALNAGSFVYLMVLLPAMLGVAGVMGGVLSSIGPQMYPAAVRVTGFTLGHSLAMSAWGGLSPFMVSAIVLLVQPSALAAGLLLVVTGLVSWAAAVPLISLMPHMNARGVRPAPQQLLVNPYKYLEGLKERRRKRRDAGGGTAAAAAAAAAVTATAAAAAAVAAAGHGVGRQEAFEGR